MSVGKSKDLLDMLDKKLSLTRRGFMKSVAAAGAAAGVIGSIGCSKKKSDGGGNASYSRYGTTAHNCGGRCITVAQVEGQGDDRRIVRFLTDETVTAYNGEPTNGPGAAVNTTESTYNSTQARACSRCRGYRGRLYHPGRLKYPLKQTRARGDATGFIRISWAEAFKEITDRLKAVQGKYGTTAFHSIYACGNIASKFQGGGYTGVFAAADSLAPALRLLGGATAYTSDYSFHQGSYMGAYGTAYSGMMNMAPTPADVATNNQYMIMWGSNIPTTHNPKAYAWVKSMEEMKKRGGQVIFIGPEFSEVGVTVADEWIRIKPYTDVALVCGMLYHMLDNTFDLTTGALKASPWLDINYLDSMVYGFFDSPEYWVKVKTDADDPAASTALGTIVLTAPAANIAKYYNHVPAIQGGSLSDYILGSATVTALAGVEYGAANMASNYADTTFGGATLKQRFATYADPKNNLGGNLSKETGISFEYKTPAGSTYKYKADLGAPKTPAWASAITGIPEARIKELAEMYITCGQNGTPIYNEWSGGQLKQMEGCVTLFALQNLLILTKNWGLRGTGIANNTIGVTKTNDPNQISAGQLTPSGWASVANIPQQPMPSVTQWHSAIKMAFWGELQANGYAPGGNVSTIPDFSTNSSLIKQGGGEFAVYSDDGGVKALLDWNNAPGSAELETFDTADGGKYFKWRNWTDANATLPATDAATTATISGFRFIFNSAGNIPMNQHANSIDSMKMFEALPTFGYGLHPAEMEEAFYMVTFDNFMSPSARYSDYVLPAKTTWEQEDFVNIDNSGTLYVDSVIPGPGESMGGFDFGREWIKAYAGESAAAQFSGIDANSTFKDYVQKTFNEKIRTDAKSPYHNKTWDEFLQKPISHAAPNLTTPTGIARSDIRKALDTYLATDRTLPFMPNITTVDATAASGVFGFNGGNFARPDECPQQSKRFQVYSGTLVWRYEHLYDKWHGYLPLNQQGQSNKDSEAGAAASPQVWPIPIYFNYEDDLAVAYNVPVADILTDYPYLLTTTHDRFRAHSSQAENPYLRELTHRIIGGDLYSGNDWKRYAISSNPDGNMDEFTNINELIGANGLPINPLSLNKASYADIWMNDQDAARESLKSGDLVKVENPIGAVYCTVRVTPRCRPGFLGLHQGCWFDPREISGGTVNSSGIVDVGGNCNTLMASTPSRIDHGNAQQSAMVRITKIQG